MYGVSGEQDAPVAVAVGEQSGWPPDAGGEDSGDLDRPAQRTENELAGIADGILLGELWPKVDVQGPGVHLILRDDGDPAGEEQMPELAQRMQIGHIGRPEMHQREVRELRGAGHGDAQLVAHPARGAVTTDQVAGADSGRVAACADQRRLHHPVDFRAALEAPSLMDVDERIALAALHQHLFEERLRQALPRLAGPTAVNRLRQRRALLVYRGQAPASDLGTVKAGSEDDIEGKL